MVKIDFVQFSFSVSQSSSFKTKDEIRARYLEASRLFGPMTLFAIVFPKPNSDELLLIVGFLKHQSSLPKITQGIGSVMNFRYICELKGVCFMCVYDILSLFSDSELDTKSFGSRKN